MTDMDQNNIEEAIKVLEDMITERIPIHLGCHLLSAMHHSGNELIWYDFDEYYYDLSDIPLPGEYELWNQEALKIKLKKLEENKESVLSMAKKMLDEIKGL
ncbi:hypothetical protein CDO73_01465 [Saccharibacillus sp. O23]|uniref:hypothetical protein n=1 Tax=Saccharibacillus sp. O23 TaxID=2009338 RepID=UPI000B4E3D71|nr:hypothetical protein [Saccharibacillus sp. O23]OWR32305.1 hypothetical protein CDO73_01465 [Saccharibacillus sp. O23]